MSTCQQLGETFVPTSRLVETTHAFQSTSIKQVRPMSSSKVLLSTSTSSSPSSSSIAVSQHGSSYRIPLRLFLANRMKLAKRVALNVVSDDANDDTDTDGCRGRGRDDDDGGGANDDGRYYYHYYYYVIMRGGVSPTRYDTDHEPVFRQESYFYWLTGVKEPDCAVMLTIKVRVQRRSESHTKKDGDDCGSNRSGSNDNSDNDDNNNNNDDDDTKDDVHVHVDDDTSMSVGISTTLLIPKLPPSYATIMGRIRTRTEWKDQYQVDRVEYVEELESTLQDQIVRNQRNQRRKQEHDHYHHHSHRQLQRRQQQQHKILLMKGPNSDSGLMYEPPAEFYFPSSSTFLSSLNEQLRLEGFSEGNVCTKATTTSMTTTAIVDVDDTMLFPILAECRVIKSDEELQLLEHVSQVSSFAHAYVMRNVFKSAQVSSQSSSSLPLTTGSRVQYEYQCESLFRHYCYFNYACRLVSYTSICGCGPNSAILHYGHAGEPNSRRIQFYDDDDDEDDGNCNDNRGGTTISRTEPDHVLFDMGAEYMCYGSDITCSFPVNGRFTAKYKQVYESVLNAQRAVIAMMRPNVSWVDCHVAAEMEILKGLYRIGIIVVPNIGHTNETKTNGSDVGDISAEALSTIRRLNDDYRFGAVFMPHGLGHFLGIDTHDVGGYLPGHPQRSPLPGLKSLRTARVLQPGMVLTVEPGCYFIDHLLDEAFNHPTLSQYLNHTLINNEYRGYGGVRLEDVVTVVVPPTRQQQQQPHHHQQPQVNGDNHHHSNCSDDNFIPGSGCINFTLCPRTVTEVEHVMAGGKWPPIKDDAPELRRVKLTTPISPLPPPPSY